MNIRNIIKEEIDDFDWAQTDESKEDLIMNALDNHFGITFNPDSGYYREIVSFNTDERPYVTYRRIRKSGLRDLYKILTKTPKYKTLFNKDYHNMVNILKSWKNSRASATMLTREVQDTLSRMGTADSGPR